MMALAASQALARQSDGLRRLILMRLLPSGRQVPTRCDGRRPTAGRSRSKILGYPSRPDRPPPRGPSPMPDAGTAAIAVTASEPTIRVRDLRKTFSVPVREGGLSAAA